MERAPYFPEGFRRSLDLRLRGRQLLYLRDCLVRFRVRRCRVPFGLRQDNHLPGMDRAAHLVLGKNKHRWEKGKKERTKGAAPGNLLRHQRERPPFLLLHSYSERPTTTAVDADAHIFTYSLPPCELLPFLCNKSVGSSENPSIIFATSISGLAYIRTAQIIKCTSHGFGKD